MDKHHNHITPSMRKTCEGCGETGKKTAKGLCRGCSKDHKRIMLARAKRVANGRDDLPPKLRDRTPIPVCKCKACGSSFTPKARDRMQFCGRSCGLAWTGILTALRANGGRVFVRCERNKRKHVRCDHPPKPAKCHQCGSWFYRKRKYQRNCSDLCEAVAYEASEASRLRSKRAARARRKAVERGSPNAVKLDPIKVFERDAWRCGLCGVKTVKAKRGTHHPKAPELDHIIAIALGGQHTYENTQCLCRSCNSKKGAASLGQLHLFPTG